MRRILIVIFIIILLGACAFAARALILPAATPTPTATVTSIVLTATALPSASPTLTITPAVSPTLLAQTPSPLPSRGVDSFEVLYHPDDALYVGDQVSIEVIAPEGVDIGDASLEVQVNPPGGQSLGPVNFAPWGIQGRNEAVLTWAWDTRSLDPGVHTLAFSVQPQGYAWTEQVTLLPASAMPAAQAQAEWTSTQTPCCTIFYITNTASDRDISVLSDQIEAQARLSMEEMGAAYTETIAVTILPRLLGHGGFASGEISVSYLDRNYAANSWEMVVHHEMVHILDGSLGDGFRPTLFVEGLAVYMSGGHYKREPLMPRAAALRDEYLDWYIPLQPLADEFYASQHEIGYLEAAALIEYMVDTYGWEAFNGFYRNITITEGQSQSQAIDAALQAHFSITFEQLEQEFLAALAAQTDTAAWVEDVRLLVTHFDLLRRYQQLLDPSAYFRTAWLLDTPSMRERGIVADYLRHPSTPTHLAVETLFVTAGQHLSAGQYPEAANTLEVIDAVLEAIEWGSIDAFTVSPMAADYFSIAAYLQGQGYEVQRIAIDGGVAQAYATTSTGPELIALELVRSGDGWALSP